MQVVTARNAMRDLTALNSLPADEARTTFLECCASVRWADQMTLARPFVDANAMYAAADRLWRALGPDDWRAAYSAHPRIGERKPTGAEHQSARTAAWSEREQSAANTTTANTTSANATTAGAHVSLVAVNLEYEARFGYVYLVCASGRSADELLADARARMHNDAATEIGVAAEEQRRITRLRLTRLLEESK